MKTFNDWVPFILLFAQAINWLILYAAKASIRIAVLEAMQQVSSTYATKEDLQKTEERFERNVLAFDPTRGRN